MRHLRLREALGNRRLARQPDVLRRRQRGLDVALVLGDPVDRADAATHLRAREALRKDDLEDRLRRRARRRRRSLGSRLAAVPTARADERPGNRAEGAEAQDEPDGDREEARTGAASGPVPHVARLLFHVR